MSGTLHDISGINFRRTRQDVTLYIHSLSFFPKRLILVPTCLSHALYDSLTLDRAGTVNVLLHLAYELNPYEACSYHASLVNAL